MERIKCLTAILAVVLFTACTSEKANLAMENPAPAMSPESFLLYKNFPSKYTNPRDIEIWLPEKYGQLEALPVLYMFDGQNIFHGTKGWSGEYNPGWQVNKVLDSLNKAGVVPEIIVVGIFNGAEKRGPEYMPAKPKELVQRRIAETEHEWYKIFKEMPPESDEHLKFVVEELKPFIDSNFKTKKDRANTFVAGSSMGGMISAYAICEYPDVFGGAACFSTHWPALNGVFTEYIKNNLPDPATHKIYFDYGTEGLDGEYEPYQLLADAAMQERGFERNRNWLTLKFEGAAHHENDWHKRFHVPMEFLFGKTEKQ
jgi:predicted alpha/beta superfamily hydrolase